MFINIVFWLISDRPSGLFFIRVRFTSILTALFLIMLFICRFVLFKTLVALS